MAVRITELPAASAEARRGKMSKRRLTAAYARVSTDHEDQLSSYAEQVSYYTNYIKSREDMDFVEVYTDEGITGTSTSRREGFKRMIADALDGKIELIITKSVSRFARNTVDSLSTIRLLKRHGIECYFERENICTFDGKCELLLSIMASLAQEESRSVSENVTWGQRRRFAAGKANVPFSRFLGYSRGPHGELVVDRNEAELVREIYSLFLSGISPYSIAKQLTARGIPSPGGKSVWYKATVSSILSNEKYRGDALLQKVFTTDFLTKQKKLNEGEVPQYYVEGSHEAIISDEMFVSAQIELERRRKHHRSFNDELFSEKIVCGFCGGFFVSKVWYSTNRYRRVIWRCACGDCPAPFFTQDELLTALDGAARSFRSGDFLREIVGQITVFGRNDIRLTLRDGAEIRLT